MLIHKINYKGKYYILQDKVGDPAWDFSIGTVETDTLTIGELYEHWVMCCYYGIPPYIGEYALLNAVFEAFEKTYDTESEL